MSLGQPNCEKSSRLERLDCIDGLRGWAAIMVLLSHLWGQFARHVISTYDSLFFRIISDGHLAVLIFFVLSGVALSLRFVRSQRPISVIPLVAARYVRLAVPILATTLIVYLLILFHISGSDAAAQLTRSEIFLGARHGQSSSLWQVFSFSSFSVLFNYDPQTTFNTSLWTMPIEFEGSLLIFGLLFLFSQISWLASGRRLAVASAIAIGLMVYSKQFSACFVAGYILAELIHAPTAFQRYWKWVPLGIIAAAMILELDVGRQEDTNGALMAIGIVMAVLFWPLAKRFFSNALSRWLGRISFPLYLIHVPLIGAFGTIYMVLYDGGMSAYWATQATLLLAFSTCLLFGWLLLPVENLSIRASRAAGRFSFARWSPVSFHKKILFVASGLGSWKK